jgi:hypothetical protein
MTASVNPNDVDINAKSEEKDEALYLKSMDSFIDELSKRYTDLSKGVYVRNREANAVQRLLRRRIICN